MLGVRVGLRICGCTSNVHRGPTAQRGLFDCDWERRCAACSVSARTSWRGGQVRSAWSRVTVERCQQCTRRHPSRQAHRRLRRDRDAVTAILREARPWVATCWRWQPPERSAVLAEGTRIQCDRQPRLKCKWVQTTRVGCHEHCAATLGLAARRIPGIRSPFYCDTAPMR